MGPSIKVDVLHIDGWAEQVWSAGKGWHQGDEAKGQILHGRPYGLSPQSRQTVRGPQPL